MYSTDITQVRELKFPCSYFFYYLPSPFFFLFFTYRVFLYSSTKIRNYDFSFFAEKLSPTSLYSILERGLADYNVGIEENASRAKVNHQLKRPLAGCRVINYSQTPNPLRSKLKTYWRPSDSPPI